MHRLVQTATQRWLENDGSLSEWQEKALAAVIRCCPPTGRYEYLEAWEAVNPHIQNVLSCKFSETNALMQRAQLLKLVAEYENYQGQHSSANTRASEATHLSCEILGDEDELTLASLSCKALALSNDGNNREAEVIYRTVWECRKRISGEENELTLQSINAVAEENRYQGKHEVAKVLQCQSLAICRRALGNEHIFTLQVMGNLAGTIAELGEVAEAEGMLRQALALHWKVAPADDPDTLFCMHELARVCQKNGNVRKRSECFVPSWLSVSDVYRKVTLTS